MKILAITVTTEAQRFVKGFPPKGAWLFLTPNLEISRLATLCTEDELIYFDERVESFEFKSFNLALIYVDFNQEESAYWWVEKLQKVNPNVVLFGPQVTSWGKNFPQWASHIVQGDITSVWNEIRHDAIENSLKPLYRAPATPRYVPLKPGIGKFPTMNTGYQAMHFVRGCACPPSLRHLCPEYLYYENETLFRSKEEILGELLLLPGKHIHLLDDDLARFPEYYYELFSLLWNYYRHWTVTAGNQLFRHPRLIRLLAKAGTKIIFLNDTFLRPYLNLALSDAQVVKWLYRQVKSLHSHRLLVGAKLTLKITSPLGEPKRIIKIANILRAIDLDFLEVRFTKNGADGKETIIPLTYHPNLQPGEPIWIKSRFYATSALFDRFLRRPRRVGFFSTLRYLIPYALAYRQNFLEGIPYP